MYFMNFMNVFQELLFSSPAMTSEPYLSESELAALRTIYKATVEQAHALHKCDTPEQAQRWADFLNCHLPEDRHAAVIRKCELNSYTVRWNSPFPEMRRSGRGGDGTLPRLVVG